MSCKKSYANGFEIFGKQIFKELSVKKHKLFDPATGERVLVI